MKESEAGVLSGEVRRRDEGLGVVRGLEARKRGLEGEIGRARGGEAGGGIEGLKGERERVDAEVRGLEERVRELKARRGGLEREIACRESEAESRVSSWVEAARGVDRAVEGFLSGLERRGEGGVAALPVGRRTLEMCRGEWEGEREALVRRREGVQREQEALDEGVRVWEEVVGVVAGVEARLREEMRGRGGEEGMRGVVEQMDQAVEILEGKVELAHARGWKLLVCAVGAEMEAFRQGRDVLRAALDGVGGEDGSRGDGEGDATGGHANDGAGSANGRAAVDEDFGGLSIGGVPVREHRVRPPSLLDRSEDEDDGPGPDFLTSHQEEDE